MKFHNYGRGIFSFVVLGNHWASWISKFTSLQFWKMFSPPCSLHLISFWNLYCWVIGFLGLILWFSSLCSIFGSIFFALLSRDFLTFSFNTSFGFFTSDMFPISEDYFCFQTLLCIAPHSSFMEEIFSLRILMSGFLLTGQSVSSVAFLFILDFLMLDAVLTQLVIYTCSKEGEERADWKL